MKCSKIKELLVAYANNELPPDRKQTVENHLENCIDCQTTLADYRVIGESLASLRTMNDIPVPADLKLPAYGKVKLTSRFHRVRYAFAAVPLVVAIVVLAVLQPWASISGPQAVIAKAITAWECVKSYRAYHSPGIIMISTDFYDNSSYGEYVLPDKMRWVLTISGNVTEYIFVDNIEYYKVINKADNNSNVIITFPKTPGINMPNQEDTIEELESISGLKQLPDEIIDGVECYHYQGTDKRSPNCYMDLWIGKDDYLIRQNILQPKNPDEVYSYEYMGETRYYKPYVSTSKYYDINKPIIIEAPLDESGKLLPGWIASKMNVDVQDLTTTTSVTDGTTTTAVIHASPAK